MILTQWNQISFVTVRKVYPELPEESEDPLVLMNNVIVIIT